MPALAIAMLAFVAVGMVIAYILTYLSIAIPVVLLGVGTYAFIRKWQTSPERQEELSRKYTLFLYERAKQAFGNAPDRTEFFRRLFSDFPDVPEEVKNELIFVAESLYASEKFGTLPEPPAICNSQEGAAYRDFLSEQLAKDNEHAVNLAADTVAGILSDFIKALPPFPETGKQITIPLYQFIDNKHKLVQLLVTKVIENTEVTKFGLFKNLTRQLNANIESLSYKLFKYSKTSRIVMPIDYKGDDVIEAYLPNTPFLDLLNIPVSFGIPMEKRFEAMWVVGRQGSGKTQLLQWLMTLDLELVAADAASIVVIDAHNDLISNIRKLKVFAPGHPLSGKLVVIEPNIDHPPALNLFDIGRGRLDQYSPTERERVVTIAEELLSYVIEAMLQEGASLTSMQGMLFGYIARLMFEVPYANLSTFSEILSITSRDRKGEKLQQYQKYIKKLSPAAQDFYRDQFFNTMLDSTKEQVGWRISALRKNQFFESMFSATNSKLDLFEELNSGKVFIVNTSKRDLGEHGTNFFGRFVIASLLTAAEERAILTSKNRKAAFVYIDEAQDYLAHDTKIATIIDQCRKMRVGLIASHQRVNQMDGSVRDALGNAAIKFANTSNHACLQTLSHALHTDSDFIAFQRDLEFAVHFSGLRRAFTFPVKAGVMENLPKMTQSEAKAVQKDIWDRYTTQSKMPKKEDVTVDGEYTVSSVIHLPDLGSDEEPDIFPTKS